MVTRTDFELMQNMVDELSSSIGDSIETQVADARDVFEFLAVDAGNIHPMGSDLPDVMRAKKEALASWDEDSSICTYGIDASSTLPVEFTNGLVFTVANAKVGVIGDGVHNLGDGSYIVGVLYDDHDHANIESQTFSTTPTTSELEVISDVAKQGQIDRFVGDAARTFAEGRYVRDIAPDVNGVIFLDGPAYPLSMLSHLLFRVIRDGENAAWDTVMGDIIRNYIQAVNTLFERGYPLVGVVKTMETSELLTALEEKMTTLQGTEPTFLWSNDNAFLSDVLWTDDPGEYTYTPWFEESRRYVQIADSKLDPFAGAPDLAYEASEYRRAFFYARIPETGTIVRIETPRGFVRTPRLRELVQHRALAEIAKMGNVPEGIWRADSEARISRENQQALLQRLHDQMNQSRNYNSDVRGPEYTGEAEHYE